MHGRLHPGIPHVEPRRGEAATANALASGRPSRVDIYPLVSWADNSCQPMNTADPGANAVRVGKKHNPQHMPRIVAKHQGTASKRVNHSPPCCATLGEENILHPLAAEDESFAPRGQSSSYALSIVDNCKRSQGTFKSWRTAPLRPRLAGGLGRNLDWEGAAAGGESHLLAKRHARQAQEWVSSRQGC